jgi:low temperature requirement protein LtrA
MAQPAGFRFRTRMTARDTDEAHRASSPLELLFDLTFVVAVSQIVEQLAKGIERGDGVASVGPFLMVFFAIWWAWMNFTWFASAYDTDDVPFRITTMVQMAGAVVLAAGVPAAFTTENYLGITLGYLIMRIGLVAQWTRAAIDDPANRTTSARYAIGITVVQLGWVARLLFPLSLQLPLFFVLVALDTSVPFWAERTGSTNWHPHHIAERYGLFTIILLGESVAVATTGVQDVVVHGLNWSLVTIGTSALVILFALWWIYFLEPAGEALKRFRARSYFWGYGHYFVFASLAALGAGLEVAVQTTGGHEGISIARVSAELAGFAVGIPVAAFLALVWVVHAPLVTRTVVSPAIILPAALIALLVPFAGDAIGLPAVCVIIAFVCVGVIALGIALKLRRMRGVNLA